MNPTLTFLFYLAAVVCFALDAFSAGAARSGRAGGFVRSVALTPLGLLLWLFPTMWTAGETAL